MNRRARAIAFALAALACAALAASIAGGYRSGIEAQLGELRPVVVASRAIDAGEMLDSGVVRRSLTVRRVPSRFVPPGSLRRPAEAIGLRPQAPIPAGSYLLAAQLAVPQPEAASAPRLHKGRRAVEVQVQGAAALQLGGPAEGARVDVVVAEQPGPSGTGRTYLAATGVRLIALRQPTGPEAAGAWGATLALTREQAIRLIAAQNYAREIRLLAAA